MLSNGIREKGSNFLKVIPKARIFRPLKRLESRTAMCVRLLIIIKEQSELIQTVEWQNYS
jgi:hypothetical protein